MSDSGLVMYEEEFKQIDAELAKLHQLAASVAACLRALLGLRPAEGRQLGAIFFSEDFFEGCEHLIVQQAVRCQHAGAVHAVRLAGDFRDASARFGDQQFSCGDIPRVQVKLPERFQPSAGDVS